MKLSNKRFQTRTLRVLFHLLPSRMKRLIFLSSLSGKVTGEKHMAQDMLIRIQEKFKLCRDPHAMELPLACTDKIWGKRPIEDLVCPVYLNANQSDHDVTRTARQIVVMMPCWLVYDNTITIVGQVRELLIARSELFAQ